MIYLFLNGLFIAVDEITFNSIDKNILCLKHKERYIGSVDLRRLRFKFLKIDDDCSKSYDLVEVNN